MCNGGNTTCLENRNNVADTGPSTNCSKTPGKPIEAVGVLHGCGLASPGEAFEATYAQALFQSNYDIIPGNQYLLPSEVPLVILTCRHDLP